MFKLIDIDPIKLIKNIGQYSRPRYILGVPSHVGSVVRNKEIFFVAVKNLRKLKIVHYHLHLTYKITKKSLTLTFIAITARDDPFLTLSFDFATCLDPFER